MNSKRSINSLHFSEIAERLSLAGHNVEIATVIGVTCPVTQDVHWFVCRSKIELGQIVYSVDYLSTDTMPFGNEDSPEYRKKAEGLLSTLLDAPFRNEVAVATQEEDDDPDVEGYADFKNSLSLGENV